MSRCKGDVHHREGGGQAHRDDCARPAAAPTAFAAAATTSRRRSSASRRRVRRSPFPAEIPAAARSTTSRALVACVACLTDFKSECTDRIAIPAAATRPECNLVNAPTPTRSGRRDRRATPVCGDGDQTERARTATTATASTAMRVRRIARRRTPPSNARRPRSARAEHLTSCRRPVRSCRRESSASTTPRAWWPPGHRERSHERSGLGNQRNQLAERFQQRRPVRIRRQPCTSPTCTPVISFDSVRERRRRIPDGLLVRGEERVESRRFHRPAVARRVHAGGAVTVKR